MLDLPQPIYFVNRGFGDRLSFFQDFDGTPDELASHMVDTRDSWITQTFFELNRLGLEVALSDHMVPDHICVAHYDDVLLGDRNQGRSFLIAIRPDRPPAPLAQLRVVQNEQCLHGPKDVLIGHWPQPGLTPRNEARGDTIERLAYVGRAYNLAPHMQTDSFRAALAELGVELAIVDDRDSETTMHDYRHWSDYSEIDLAFAVRPEDKSYWNYTKPASKLVNAWLAGCPALLGPETGYQQLRESELDYIEVESTDDVLQAVRKLKDDPELYHSMIQNGLERSREHDRQAIANTWFDLLTGETVRSAYREWSTNRRKAWLLLPQAGHAMRSALHVLARKRPEWPIVLR